MQISPQTLTSRVADALIERIQQGVYAVGAKLPAGRLLAQEFNVSAAVIREATERLRTKGLVESRQGAGCRVLASSVDEGFQLIVPADVDKTALRHIYELRCEIEAGAASLAALHAGPDEIALMEDILRSLKKSLGAPDQALEWDLAFHKAIAKATHNPHYMQLMQYLNEQWRYGVRAARLNTLALDRARKSTPSKAGLASYVHDEHVAVLAAIKQHDPALARSMARKHLHNASQRLGLDVSFL
jgi:DNA-binding FadR family transcriptional regulator